MQSSIQNRTMITPCALNLILGSGTTCAKVSPDPLQLPWPLPMAGPREGPREKPVAGTGEKPVAGTVAPFVGLGSAPFAIAILGSKWGAARVLE